MSFGELLKSHRNKRNLKLTTAAQMFGISSSYLSSLESGRRPAPSSELLQTIADALDLNIKERHELYDLAAEGKQPLALADDINAYIYSNPQIRDMLRYSMECGLAEKDWEVILAFIKKNYYY